MVQSIVSYLGFSNLGIAQGAANFFTEKYGASDVRVIKEIASSGFWLYLVIVVAIILILGLLSSVITIEEIFNISEENEAVVMSVLVISSLFFLCRLPLTIFSSTLRSLNLIYKEQFYALITTIIQVSGILIVLFTGGDIVGLSWVYGMAGLFLGIVLFFHLRHEITDFSVGKKNMLVSILLEKC